MMNEAVALESGMSKNEALEPDLLPCLISIAKTVRQLVSIDLSECDVEPGQDQFLLSLADRGDMSVAEVADRLSIRPSTVSKMADHLCRKGWMTRRSDTEDQRRVRIRLTNEGSTIVEAVRAIHANLERELWKALGTDGGLMPKLSQVDRTLIARLRRRR